MPATLTPLTGDGTVPTGGTTDQLLRKTSSTNYATGWVTSVVSPTAPSTGQILVGGGFGTYAPQTLTGTGATITLNSSGVLALSGIPDGSILSASTWNTASSERRQWDGSSTNLVAATGRTSLAIGDAAVYENASGAGSTGYASNTILPGSTITIPTAGGWAQGGQYHCVFDMAKTAAGTAAIFLNVHMGTAGTTADAIVGTVSFGAGAATADSGVFDVYVTFKTVGSGTSAVVVMGSRVIRAALVAGLVNGTNPVQVTNATSAGFASTTQTKISIAFNGGSLFSGTNLYCQTQYMQ